MKHVKSEKLYQRALDSIPGGVDSPVRAFKSVGTVPIFAKRGNGIKLSDVDGNVYDDYILSWGPLILGHANPIVREGVTETIEDGTTFGLSTELEVELAERIKKDYPSIEKIRFVSSGTEAVMSALRLARGYTGRDKIVKFSGGYHGHADSVLVEAGSGLMTESIATSSGIPDAIAEDTFVLDYNDREAAEKLFRDYGEEIAAVIVEPVAGNMGVIAPEEDFLKTLKTLCSEYGALLIFDEVITGYRVGLGGMQEREGISPDITTLGKIIGGGMPIGAFGARAEIMDVLAPTGEVYQAGTLSGNPVAMKMGINQIKYLQKHPEIYSKMGERAEYIEDSLKDVVQKLSLPVSISRYGAMLTIFFRDEIPRNYRESKESDTGLYARFFKKMLERGILIPPSQFEALFLSSEHDQDTINRFVETATEVLKTMDKEVQNEKSARTH